jgi:hypothetical protein
MVPPESDAQAFRARYHAIKGWPDGIVAAIMAVLALQGSWVVIRKAWGELRPSLVLA